ncbi:MAG: hypothetical protein IJ215_05680 [Clostridia bacterium]|nr:hypothetical protein [Clostridia bacterium]
MKTSKSTKITRWTLYFCLGILFLRIVFPGLTLGLNMKAVTVVAIVFGVLAAWAWATNQGMFALLKGIFSGIVHSDEEEEFVEKPVVDNRRMVHSVGDEEDDMDIMDMDLSIPEIPDIDEPAPVVASAPARGTMTVPFAPETLRSMVNAGVTMKLIDGQWTVSPL